MMSRIMSANRRPGKLKTAALGVVALGAGFAAVPTASAAAAPPTQVKTAKGVTPAVAGTTIALPVPSACPTGFVCLVSQASPVQFVQENQQRAFDGGLATLRVVNRTRLNYCVSGTLSYAVPPGGDVIRANVVYGIAPGDFCAF